MSHVRALLPVCLLGATSSVCAQTDEIQTRASDSTVLKLMLMHNL